jgi:hypothetical protein
MTNTIIEKRELNENQKKVLQQLIESAKIISDKLQYNTFNIFDIDREVKAMLKYIKILQKEFRI